jgi:hypothetical protein
VRARRCVLSLCGGKTKGHTLVSFRVPIPRPRHSARGMDLAESALLNVTEVAKTTWLDASQCLLVLREAERFGWAVHDSPVLRPPGEPGRLGHTMFVHAVVAAGSVVLFRRTVKFRADGYNWKRKQNGQVLEGHMQLVVDGVKMLHSYYGRGEDDCPMQRRIVWLLDEHNWEATSSPEYVSAKAEHGAASPTTVSALRKIARRVGTVMVQYLPTTESPAEPAALLTDARMELPALFLPDREVQTGSPMQDLIHQLTDDGFPESPSVSSTSEQQRPWHDLLDPSLPYPVPSGAPASDAASVSSSVVAGMRRMMLGCAASGASVSGQSEHSSCQEPASSHALTIVTVSPDEVDVLAPSPTAVVVLRAAGWAAPALGGCVVFVGGVRCPFSSCIAPNVLSIGLPRFSAAQMKDIQVHSRDDAARSSVVGSSSLSAGDSSVVLRRMLVPAPMPDSSLVDVSAALEVRSAQGAVLASGWQITYRGVSEDDVRSGVTGSGRANKRRRATDNSPQNSPRAGSWASEELLLGTPRDPMGSTSPPDEDEEDDGVLEAFSTTDAGLSRASEALLVRVIEGMAALAEGQSILAEEIAAKEPTTGLSLLHVCCMYGADSMVPVLCGKGAQVEERTAMGDTPLGIAASRGHSRVCSALLRAGADPRATNHEEMTPSRLAALSGFIRLSVLLHQLEQGWETEGAKSELVESIARCVPSDPPAAPDPEITLKDVLRGDELFSGDGVPSGKRHCMMPATGGDLEDDEDGVSEASVERYESELARAFQTAEDRRLLLDALGSMSLRDRCALMLSVNEPVAEGQDSPVAVLSPGPGAVPEEEGRGRSVQEALLKMSLKDRMEVEEDALLIQRSVRTWLLKRSYQSLRMAARTLQAALRGRKEREQYSKARAATRTIQASIRGHLARREFARMRRQAGAAMVIQRALRQRLSSAHREEAPASSSSSSLAALVGWSALPAVKELDEQPTRLGQTRQ